MKSWYINNSSFEIVYLTITSYQLFTSSSISEYIFTYKNSDEIVYIISLFIHLIQKSVWQLKVYILIPHEEKYKL